MPPRNRFPNESLGLLHQWEFPNAQGQYTHPEALVKITSQTDMRDLYGHCTALMFALECFPLTPVKLPFQAIDHVHRSGYRLLTTTHLAQDIKQLVPISITIDIAQHLRPALPWCREILKF